MAVSVRASRHRLVLRLAGLVLLSGVGAAGCSFALDFGGLESSTASGGNGGGGGAGGGCTVSCSGVCCDLDHATAVCDSEGACAVVRCDAGFDDCNGEPGDGCEADLRSDPDNCGRCKRRCGDLPNTVSSACDASACRVISCVAHYGDCDSDAPGCETLLTGDDRNGACDAQVIAQHQQYTESLALDGDNVYWTTGVTPTVGGGVFYFDGATSFVHQIAQAPADNLVEALTVADAVYFTFKHAGAAVLYKVDKLGHDMPVKLADTHHEYGNIAVAGGYVYYGNFEDATMASFTGDISRVSTDGFGTPEVLVAGLNQAHSAVIDGNDLFVTIAGEERVLRLALDGSKAKTLVDLSKLGRNDVPAHLIRDGKSLFWTDFTPGNVMTVDEDGSHLRTLAVVKGSQPDYLAVDATYVYWAAEIATDGGIFRTRRDGTGKVEAVAWPKNPRGVAVDHKYVYWADRRDGGGCGVPDCSVVVRMPKKP